MDELTPEERDVVAQFEERLRAWGDAETIGSNGANMVEAAESGMRGNVRRIMEAMGYAEGDIAPAVESVAGHVSGGDVVLDFAVPDRVAAFIDATGAGDFERAELIMRAREG